MLAAIALAIFSSFSDPQASSRTTPRQTQGAVAVAGVVQDQTGAVLPGAQVSIVREGETAASQQIVSDTAGAFRFERIAPGNYTVRTEFPGFKTNTTAVRVTTRPPSALKVVMEIEGLSQEVSVTSGGEAAAKADSNLNAITVSGDTLDDMPVLDEDVVGSLSRFLDSSAIDTNGTSVVIDGLEVDGLGVSASAIQQVKINQNPYAAEFERPGRGRIEIVTKPGGQNYSGTFNFRFRDSDIDARNAFAESKPDEQRRSFEGSLGGPVPRTTRTSFTLNGFYHAQDTESIVFADTLSGPFRANIASPSRDVLVAGSWNHMQGDANTQTIRFSHRQDKDTNDGVGGTSLPDVASNERSREDRLTFTQQTVVSPTLLNEFRLLVGDQRDPTVSLRHDPRIVVDDAFTGGGAQNDSLRTVHRFTLTEALTWSAGRHTIKSGVNIPDWSWRAYDDNTNRDGTFHFSSLADYAAGRPYSFTQQAGDGHVAFVEKVVGLFAQDEIRVKPNLSLDVGLRYDWQSYFGDTNNFAPRFSFAYAPMDRTVVRGGVGMFYDRTGPGPIQDLLRFDGAHLQRYVIVDPGYPDPLSGGDALAAPPASIVTLAPDAKIPFTVQYSVGVERQLRPRTTLSVTFIGTRGIDMFRSRDVNAPPPPDFAARPDPTRGVVRQIEAAGRLQTASLQFTLRGRMSRFFNGSVEYTYGRAFNDSSGIGWMPPNSYDLSLEYARADWNRRHRLEMFGSFTPGMKLNFGVSASVSSGRPYSLTTGLDAFNTGSANARPDGVPRNSLTGPTSATVDLRWSREFDLSNGKRKRTITPGIDAFNVLNRVNYGTPVGNLSSRFFGQSISAQSARRVQFSLRVRY